MKPSAIVSSLLVCRFAGAFVGIIPSKSSPSTSPSSSCLTHKSKNYNLAHSHCRVESVFKSRRIQHNARGTTASSASVFAFYPADGKRPRRALTSGLSAADATGETGDGGEGEDGTGAASSANMSDTRQDQGEDIVADEGTQTGTDSSSEAEDEDEEEQLFVPTGDITDRRLYRAKLFAGSDEKWKEQLRRNGNQGQLAGQDAWAHELSAPEKGCLIVAKSSVFSIGQTYFNEAVIFLASHDESGSAGFILNRPTSVSLGGLVDGAALPEFGASPLYLGGDVGEGNVQILHPFGPDQLPGATQVIPGVYIGGAVDDANRMVAAGKAKAEDFKFYLHLCGWAPGQLEAEIERGVWFAAACSANVILKHCISLPMPMWREIMTLMGPKYSLLARDTYDDL